MNLKQVLAAFPPKSPYRRLIPSLLSKDETAWKLSYKELKSLDRLAPGEYPMGNNWKHKITEALAMLKAATTLPFAYLGPEWDDPVHELIFPLLRSPHPQLLPIVLDGYERLSDRSKCAALSLMGAIGTHEAATGFVSCIRTNPVAEGCLFPGF